MGNPGEVLLIALVTIWCFAAVMILLFSAEFFFLALRAAFDRCTSAPSAVVSEWPMVTIQLPVYNEKTVINRLISAVGEMDYPPALLEVQVLDDSTDETSDLVKSALGDLLKKGISTLHIKRDHRRGFKAGALAAGTESAKGEFIAIFDADFLPPRDFLRKTIPLFQDASIGIVQCRWGHLNRSRNLLTRMQALALDAHFLSEQQGRVAAGCFAVFNGSAGLWRKSCILNAGGWHGDTVTEDLDLSVRAQLKGWKVSFLPEVVVQAELPADVRSVLNQQFRWSRGGAQTAVKLNGSVLRAGIGWRKRIHAMVLLNGQAAYFLLLMAAISSMMLAWMDGAEKALAIQWTGLLSIFGMLLYLMAQLISVVRGDGPVLRRISRIAVLPLLMIFMMGLSLRQSIAVAGGWLGRSTAFIRTPKHGEVVSVSYLPQGKWSDGWLELCLSFVFGITAAVTFNKAQYSFLPFHCSMAAGLLIVGILTVFQIFDSGESTSRN